MNYHVSLLLLLLIALSLPPAKLVAQPGPAKQDSESVELAHDQSDGSTSVASLIEGLDSDQFAVRQESERELLRLGREVIPIIRQSREDSQGEQRERLDGILRELERSVRLFRIVRRPELDHVTSVEISSDGRHLYTAAWTANSIAHFVRDPQSGALEFKQAITNDELNGVVSLRLSPDGRLAVAPAFRARTVTVFRRDIDSGDLSTDVVLQSEPDVTLFNFPIEACFCPQSKFLFVLDCQHRSGGATGGILVFHVTAEGEIEFVQENVGERSCFDNARGIAFHPGANRFYVTSSDAGTLTRVSWNQDTGQTSVDQVLRDGEGGVEGLAGAFSVVVSDDGRFVYTSSGRFSGDSAVGVYEVAEDGSLRMEQELIVGRDELGGFSGGNELVLSPDGQNLYVTGTQSATISGFARDEESGRLRFIETIPFPPDSLGPAGVDISPDGDYLYVAVEGQSGLALLRRDTAADAPATND